MSSSPVARKSASFCLLITAIAASTDSRSAGVSAFQFSRGTSVAPALTAPRRSSFRSMPRPAVHREARGSSLGECPPRVPGEPGEPFGGAEGCASGPANRAGMRDVCPEDLLERPPGVRRLEQAEAQVREALERELRAPRGSRGKRKRPAQSPCVWAEIGGAAGNDVERVLNRELRAQQRLVDPVARDGIDEPCGVADERGPPADRREAWTAKGQPVAADLGERVFRNAVLTAQA